MDIKLQASFRDNVQLTPVLANNGQQNGDMNYFDYNGHRFTVHKGRLNTAVCVGVLEASGWKFHTVDDRLYWFTSPDGESIHMSMKYMRYVVTLMIVKHQAEMTNYLKSLKI